MQRCVTLFRPSTSCLSLILVVVIAGCESGSNGPAKSPPFTYEIAPSDVSPMIESIGDRNGGPPRAVGAYVDAEGVQTDFVLNEVVVAPRDMDELADFLTAYGGTVIGDDHVPEPPPEAGVTLSDEDRIARFYTVRITSMPILDDDTFESEANAKGLTGRFAFSSETAAQLIALSTHEIQNGRVVIPNFAYHPTGMLHETNDFPLGAGKFFNALDFKVFKGPTTPGGNRSNVSAAWQFMNARGFSANSVRVAVIDSGYWLNPDGTPMVSPVSATDFAVRPLQWDFAGNDANADGPSLMTCTRGEVCNWHGNRSASTAAAPIDNFAGAAGTGGQVAEPVLFNIDGSLGSMIAAVRSLKPWGVKVASISISRSCNADCRRQKDLAKFFGGAAYDYDGAYEAAIGDGVVIVAAAGNDNVNVNAQSEEPCWLHGVICVGALADGRNTKISYSNYGDGVDIWAPTNIPSMPDGDNQTALPDHGGTSAAVPFVAGVVAMMKAVNPGLNADQVLNILWSTAWNAGTSASLDPHVSKHGYLNALDAVRTAAGRLPDDRFEPNNTTGQARPLDPGDYEGLTLNGSDFDYYTFTIPDYGYVTLNLEYMAALGVPTQLLTSLAGTDLATKVTYSKSSRGSHYEAFLPPGTFRFLVSGHSSMSYAVHLALRVTGLEPDEFEWNDQLWTPADFPPRSSESTNTWGAWSATLHNDADIDFYYFVVPGADLADGMGYFSAGIVGSDVPIEAWVIDPTLEAFTPQTGTDVQFTFHRSDAGKAFFLQVRGARTRYTVFNGMQFPAPDFVEAEPVWWPIDEGGERYSGVLTSPDEWVAILGSPVLATIDMYAPGLDFTLVGGDGTPLAQGTERLDPTDVAAPTGEHIAVGGLLDEGTTYYLHLTREEIGTTVDGAPMFLGGQISFSMGAGVAPETLSRPRFAYAANYGDGTVSSYTVDAITGRLRATGRALAGTSPISATVDPTGQFVYVANEDSNDISSYRIDSATGRLRSLGANIATGTRPKAVTLDHDGRFAYVANWDSNSVSAYSIDESTGMLSSVGAVLAGTNPISVAIDPAARFAYVANWGSNNISAYSIDAVTGALSSVGALVAAGQNPIAISLDPDGNFAYVANWGSNSVSMYSVHYGTLTSLGAPVAAGTAPGTVSVHPSGEFAYVTNAGDDTVATYLIHETTGVLTRMGKTIAAGDEPSTIAFDPSGTFAYLVNYRSNDIWTYSVNLSTGTWTRQGANASGMNPASVVVSRGATPLTRVAKFAYVANSTADTVSAYRIDPYTGALSSVGDPVVTGDEPQSVTVDPAGRFAYVTSWAVGYIYAYWINPVTGALTSAGEPFATGANPLSLTIDSSGRFAYVLNSGPNNITQYAIEPTTGALSLVFADALTGSRPISMALDPSGRFAYVANWSSGDISAYNIDPVTGALTSLGTSVDTGVTPVSASVDPTGQFLHVACWGSGYVASYHIDPVTGALRRVDEPVATGNGPYSITLAPNGGFAYVANNLSASLSVYGMDSLTGVLASLGNVSAGTGPIGGTIDGSGKFFYVTNADDDTVSAYSISAATGELTSIGAAVPTGDGPRSITVVSAIQ